MANLLSLRTAPGASILKLDAAFFDASVAPLLQKRGFLATASARSAGPGDAPAAFEVDVDAVTLERLLSGKAPIPQSGTITATAAIWRALLHAATARDAGPKGGARDVGGQTTLGGGATRDWIREKSGRRVKARPKTRSLKIAAAPSTAAASAPSTSVTDPAAFALANLARLASLVVARSAALPDSARIALQSGVVVVDGVATGPLLP